MTVYYVSPNGNDANNGLGPDASHSTNKPWLTIGKALGASGISSGDTVYIAPGTYREVVTVAMTSAIAETFITGDPSNSQSFKDGSGVLLNSGDVVWTSYTTNDTTNPSGSPLLQLAGRDFLTFRNILFMGSTSTESCIHAETTNAINITFRDCGFIPYGVNSDCISYVGLADVASNWIIDRCYFVGGLNGSFISIVLPTSASADYDSNFLIQNCVTIGSNRFVIATSSGANSFKGGGVDIFNCTAILGGNFLATTSNTSTSIPCTAYNSVFITGPNTSLSAGTSGQIVEDYNRIVALTPRSNVSTGANSISNASHALMLEIGQSIMMGRNLRSFMLPAINSPLLGRGNQAGGPTVDILNRSRPAGGNSTSYAWGAYERHDTGAKETSVVRTGSTSLKLTGPSDQDFIIPVDNTSTTVSIYGRYDTNHGTTNKPQMTVLNGEECGVTSATATMTVGVDTWEQLSLNFTPTQKGIVTIRLISRSSAGNGIAYFDDFNVQ